MGWAFGRACYTSDEGNTTHRSKYRFPDIRISPYPRPREGSVHQGINLVRLLAGCRKRTLNPILTHSSCIQDPNCDWITLRTSSFLLLLLLISIIMSPPLIGGGIKRCFCLTSVCRVHPA